MAYTLAFTVSQGIDSSAFTLTDLSTGSDGTITGRRVVVTQADGETLVPTGTSTTYIDFPFPDGASITVSVLNVDYSLSIRLEYIDSGGNIIYSLSQNYTFTGNDEDFDYSLTQMLVANQGLMQDTGYVMNRFTFRMLMDSATQAVETGNDINGGQFLLDLAQNYVNNQTMFF